VRGSSGTGEKLTINLVNLTLVRSLLTMHSHKSDGAFAIWLEGEDQLGAAATWNVCDPCDKGFTDLADVESPGKGLKINKIEYRGSSADPSDEISICEVFAFEGISMASSATTLVPAPPGPNNQPGLS